MGSMADVKRLDKSNSLKNELVKQLKFFFLLNTLFLRHTLFDIYKCEIGWLWISHQFSVFPSISKQNRNLAFIIASQYYSTCCFLDICPCVFNTWIFAVIHIWIYSISIVLFNPFVPNAPCLYTLKTSGNRNVFWCFQGVEKRCTGKEWVKRF